MKVGEGYSGEVQEGPKNEGSEAYTFSLQSLREKILEEVTNKQEIEPLANRLNFFRSILMKSGNRVLKASETIEDNQFILDFVNELADQYNIVFSGFLFAMAKFLRADVYSREELINIINSSRSYSFIHGLLHFIDTRMIFEGMSNEEIVDFCTSLIKKFSEIGQTEEETRDNYIFNSAHVGYEMWDDMQKFIKLDDDLNKTIETGLALGDEFVWGKILKERKDDLQKLPREEREKIAIAITNSIQAKRGLPLTDMLTRDGDFGLTLSSKIDEMLQ